MPDRALLARHRAAGAYADAYVATLDSGVTQAGFVEAFYTTWLFKLERAVLARAVAKPSTDGDARALATGSASTFAAWHVEDRTDDQLLLCDYRGRTRSWLMSLPEEGGTRLYFGSAVVPVTDARTGARSMGWPFAALLGFHRLYSRLLLGAAVGRLRRAGPFVGAT